MLAPIDFNNNGAAGGGSDGYLMIMTVTMVTFDVVKGGGPLCYQEQLLVSNDSRTQALPLYLLLIGCF